MKKKRALAKSLKMNKRGSLTLLVVIVAVVLALSSTVYYVAKETPLINSLTGTIVGIQTISGACNISVRESILNIGHDYECQNTDGFQINANNIVLDCQNHYIKCVAGCNNSASDGPAGIRLSGRSNVTIKNCYIYNFTNGIRIEQGSHDNIFTTNFFYNNSNGININNGTANNITHNIFNYNTFCGINISSMNNSLVSGSTYNNIWDNKIFNSSGGYEACNDVISYNHWNLEKTCPSTAYNSSHTYAQAGISTTNFRSGQCLGGNWWASYMGMDTSGDGLGDTLTPYNGGNILQIAISDAYPLVDSCNTTPALISEDVTCGAKTISSTSGEGYAIIGNNVDFTCNGTILNGINGTSSTARDDMRGIEIKNVHDITVTGCEIYNFMYGIYIENSYNIKLNNLIIYNNNNTGVYVGSLAYNVTINNSRIGNTNFSYYQDYGIWLKSSKPSGGNNLIYSNTIHNNTLGGIYLSDNSNLNSIYSNTIYGNYNGIFVNTSDNNNIYNNTLYNNTNAGINVFSSQLSSLGTGTSKNTIYNNTYGYYLERVTSDNANGITGDIFNNNYGIFMFNSSPNIASALVRNNTNTGIYLEKSNNVKLNTVNVSINNRGVYVANSTGLIFSDVNDVYINNNTFGLYLFNTSRSSFEPLAGLTILNIYNNNYNIILENSLSNIFNGLTIFGGIAGFNLTQSNNNTIKSNIVSNFTSYNFNLSLSSNNNTIYNNYIGNLPSGGGVLAYDNCTNYWNTSKQFGTNILGYSYLGGNYWGGVSINDTNRDGLGDIPNGYNITGGANTDYLPLTTPLFTCSNYSVSYTFTQNVSANGSCIIVTADNITLNLAGFYLLGNSSGVGINITGRQGVIIINANIFNFSTGIAVSNSAGRINLNYTNFTQNNIAIAFANTNSSSIFKNHLFNNTYGITLTNSYNNTISNNTNISNNYRGITLTASPNNIIFTNRITNNPLGLSITTSTNNLIYNNYFNNTINAQDDGSTNKWNTSYLQFGGNILEANKNSTGGNFWSDYIGKDFGGGSDPYNNSNDGVGDTAIPYTNNGLITGGDYLPLTLSTTSDTTSCQSISTDTILTSDISCSGGNGVTITDNSVSLNCNNHIISGDGTGAGISIDGKQNIIIKNCNITNFYYGIKLLNTKNAQITPNNYLLSNNFYGVYLYQANDTKIESNSISNDNNGIYSIGSRNTTINNNKINLQKKFYGVYLFNSPTNSINNNTFWQNYHGIYLVESPNTNITNNNITISDAYSIFLNKNTVTSHFLNNLLSLGTEGIRIKQDSDSNYFFNNTILDHSSYGLDSTDSDSNVYVNNSFSNNSINVYLSNSSSNTFINNTILNSPTGIQVVSSSNSLTITSNVINSSTSPSLSISSSSSPNLQSNKIYNDVILNTAYATSCGQNNSISTYLNITNSNNLTLSNNTLQYVYLINTSGSSFSLNNLIQLNTETFSSGNIYSNILANNNLAALNLQTITSSNIYSNNIQNTSTALLLTNSSNNNNIYTNWLKSNTLGLNLSSSTGNKIYNNYFSNTNNAADTTSGNKWNTTLSCSSANIVGGPCQGGNFYSTYYGLDNGAGSRDQGDGIGDQPANFTINSDVNAYDYLPLVLYVARQYYSPLSADDSLASSMTAIGNTSGTLSNGSVVPNEVQIINYSYGGSSYAEITALFNQSNVNTNSLKINFNANKTALNKTGVNNLGGSYNLYLYHNYGFDIGVYLCPEIYNLSLANASCPNRIIFNGTDSVNGYVSGITLSLRGNYYKISNISNNSMAIVLNNNDYCGKNVFHNVTFNRNLSCSGPRAALTVTADNITLDFAGFALIGNGTGTGLNISGRSGVVIKNANILNFSTGIYVNPSLNITITNSNISNNTIGLSFRQTNYSLLTNNRIINNSIGFNLSFSYNNSIYNNYFGNIINNSIDNGDNYWNTTLVCTASTTNIMGGNCSGGNYWSDYTGWDLDFDGIGSTLMPYNNSNSIKASFGGRAGGDYLPLTDYGKIACGGTTQNVSNNLTLNRNLIAIGTGGAANNCFTIAADSVIINCQNYIINGTGSSAVSAENRLGLTVQNCYLFNFTQAIYFNNTNQSLVTNNLIYNNTYGTYVLNGNYNNITFNNIYNNGNGSYLFFANNTKLFNNKIYSNVQYGLYLENSTLINATNNLFNNTNTAFLLRFSHFNYFNNNTLKNNTFGINLTTSWNNTIFNNYFNNTNNAWDLGSSNYWNTSYACTASTKNILGNNCSGGNFWGDYNGSDNGLGTETFNNTPWNISGNGIGDTQIPYNNSHKITLGDYLPLTGICGNGVKEGNEGCDTSDFGGLTCASYGYLYGSLSCSACTISSSACTNTSSSSSSSSSSGGGGGGGGGSSTSSTVAEVTANCTQSWTCGGWTECIGGMQMRNCNDANDCNNKKSAGKVANVFTISKPTETRSCVMPEIPEVTMPPIIPTSPEKAPLIEKVKEALPEAVMKPSPTRTITLSSAAAAVLFGGIYVLWQFASTPNRLRRRMRKLEPLLNEESADLLKQNYLNIYNLYLKLSESHKQNFYGKVSKLRETIEEQLKAEKKIEELFQTIANAGEKADILEQKKIYLNIYKNYQKLPGKVQGKYYPRLVSLREQLERGRVGETL